MVKEEQGNVAVAPNRTQQRRGVFIQMPQSQHIDLKVRAAQAGTTLQNLVSGLLSEALERDSGRGQGRGRRGA